MTVRILIGDVRDKLRELPDDSVHCVVTSPPYYGLRDYGVAGQIGLEPSPAEYVETLVAVFRDVRRVLRKDGTVFLNLGDSYASSPPGNKTRGVSSASTLNGINGSSGQYRETPAGGHATKRDTSKIAGIKPKDLLGIPWMVAFALRADGWWLRQDIIWSKPNPMPESVTDRCTKAHEYLFLLSRSERYWFDADAIAEDGAWCGKQLGIVRGIKVRAEAMGRAPSGNEVPGVDALAPDKRNKRSVWTVSTQPYAEAHFATFPPALVEPCILAGTSEKGVCAKCGAPWARVVEKERTFQSGSGRSGNMPIGKNGPALQGGGATLDIRRGPCVETVTTGWLPSCACNAATMPATVLDPFGGAGTTALVADRLGRDAILIELNPAYAEMARRRISDDMPPLFATEVA